jgi:hypothetical protein
MHYEEVKIFCLIRHAFALSELCKIMKWLHGLHPPHSASSDFLYLPSAAGWEEIAAAPVTLIKARSARRQPAEFMAMEPDLAIRGSGLPMGRVSTTGIFR